MRTILITIIVGTSFMVGAAAQQSGRIGWQHNAQSIIGALDYVAIDYPQAVQNSAVINTVEYAEQREFVTTVHELLLSLPARPQRESLLEQAQALLVLVEQRAAAGEVAAVARQLAAGLIDTYDLIIAPLVPPDPAAAAPLFGEYCAGCHGISGRGDGPAGAAFDPAPTDFHNVERARQRSLYGLYSTITLGVQGTGMPSFANLTETQRWALAFYVAGLRDDTGTIAQGERFWNQGMLHEVLPTLASLTSSVPADIEKSDEAAAAVLAFLRHRPRALRTPSSDPIERTIRGLQDAVLAYSNDQPDAALQLTLSAYLEGYELIEGALGTLDAELAVGIERDMQVLRNMIRERVSVEAFESTATGLYSRLNGASSLLTDRGLSSVTLFTSALVILLREGVEAILLLAAMGLYLRRTEHTNAMQ
jgi:high-affinity iron transporter